jgi:two-component system, NtrC family, sensor kinase
MKLFLAIYSCLLVSVIVVLAIEGNISYETAIRQFEANQVRQAEQVGMIVSAMVSETWLTNGRETALKLIENANRADRGIVFRWVFFTDLPAECRRHFPDNAAVEDVASDGSVSCIAGDGHGQQHRYTYVPTPIPGNGSGLLELSQSLTPLADYTRKMLIRSLAITGLLAVLSGVIIYLFIHARIRRPLERLSAKAVRIGKGDVEANLEIKGNDELADLARTMNDMCTRLLIAKGKIHFEHEARIKTLEQLRHSEKLSTIGQMSAGIAHELGTPLNVVDGRATMIIREGLDREEMLECARIIKNQAEKMAVIIRRLLEFSRRGKAKKSNEHVEILIRQVFRLLQPLAARQNASLVLAVEPGTDPLVHGDPTQIQQILTNIIINGLQAMPDPGTITVSLANVEVRSIEKTDGQKKQFLKLVVTDEGTGIEEGYRDRLFEPFFTTKQTGSGTGLGLSITKELVEEHGGWIEAHGGAAGGASFWVFLPSGQEPQR